MVDAKEETKKKSEIEEKWREDPTTMALLGKVVRTQNRKEGASAPFPFPIWDSKGDIITSSATRYFDFSSHIRGTNQPNMSQTVSQIIFFRVKSSVKPEDPVSEEGEALLKIFRTTQQQSGHKHSSWGRTVEDKDTIVWVIGEFSNPLKHPTTINFRYIQPPYEPTTYGSNQTNRLDRPS